MDPADEFPHGTWRAGRNLAAAAARHVRARWSLFALEARAAGVEAAILAGLSAAIALSLLIAYLFLAVSVGFLIAWLCHAIGGVWVLVMLGTGLAHVALAGIFVLALKQRARKPFFPETRAELHKDFE